MNFFLQAVNPPTGVLLATATSACNGTLTRGGGNLATSAAGGGGSVFLQPGDIVAWTEQAPNDICPYATFQMPKEHQES
jgi:hypothetical protein